MLPFPSNKLTVRVRKRRWAGKHKRSGCRYQKYLYDYECEREGLSKPEDLQAAIEGNRREGRRTTGNYSPYSLGPSLVPTPNNGTNGPPPDLAGLADLSSRASQQAAIAAASAYREQLAALDAARARPDVSSALLLPPSSPLSNPLPAPAAVLGLPTPSGRLSITSNDDDSDPGGPDLALTPAAKRPRLLSSAADNNPLTSVLGAMSSAHLKMTSSGTNSLIVSMEVNGVMYQGVLFASAATNTRP